MLKEQNKERRKSRKKGDTVTEMHNDSEVEVKAVTRRQTNDDRGWKYNYVLPVSGGWGRGGGGGGGGGGVPGVGGQTAAEIPKTQSPITKHTELRRTRMAHTEEWNSGSKATRPRLTEGEGSWVGGGGGGGVVIAFQRPESNG